MDDGMPFLCPIPKCGKRFTNEDHLNVHSKTHEMSLALNTEKTSSSPAHPFVDQTPTPTKILKTFGEIGLFQELSKNPFDDAYKKALDSEVAPLPGPQTNELNTPTLIMTDTTRHASTSNTTGTTSLFPLAVDRLKSSAENKIRPSPLAAQNSSSSSGKKISNVTTKSLGLNLSNKNVSSLNSSPSIITVTRSKLRDLTSQVADSTSTDVTLDLPNDGVGMREDDDSAFLGATQSITSPHSTTTIISTTSNLGKPPSSIEKAVEEVGGCNASTTTTTVTAAAKVKTEVLTDDMATSQQQCTMQVLLQLPNGQTVPISIPATINNPLIVDDKEQQHQQQQQQQHDVKPQVTTVVIPQQQQHQPQLLPGPPVLKPAPSKTRVVSASGPTPNTTTMTLKQRLKAQLQSQLSPTAKSSSSSFSDQNFVSNTTSSAFVPAASVPTVAVGSNNSTNPAQQMTQMFITQTSSSPPLMMMMDSPGSEVNMSDSSEYSFESKRQKMSPDCEDPEERRRKFLERNRAAAARCRQKRKHWIGNLERKADDLQNTNLRLQNDVKLLRGEVAHLKTLLLAHKDCPVTQQQRSSGQLQQVLLTENPTAFSNQELAQVVPTGGDSLTSESIPIGQTTIMTFLSDGTGVTRRAAGLSENGKDDD